ncbi:MAG: hypothetical protein A2W35_18895 [Chloroflexi bacterium RBG_16_57_11]|nr:MAG: hypothetical protein A2W35_18895 [Chloroflexi bacterium RBG_16_57_11]
MKRRFKHLMNYLKDNRSLQQQLNLQGLYPLGHYYSPIPVQADVQDYLESMQRTRIELPEIKLNREKQFSLLNEFQAFYHDLPFPEEKRPSCRYYYNQIMFCYADAIFLYCFLRRNQPGRIIEVGSGFSSAIILDTVEKFYNHQPEVTFIDPYPETLMSVLKPHDRGKVNILDIKVQDADLEVFTSLKSGDLLFIDSSHVVKCGSDVQHIIFKILPQLSSGVIVHFHDIFYPFEYPDKWLLQGRYWNEAYFLRAFLAYNNVWDIYFFNPYVALTFKDYIETKMPLCLKDTGGSLYIQRLEKATDDA